jgi:crotonobetainyl-CoA:carnitine CoA-transferase CaiB-like acyl-CoA transferase
MGLMDGIRVTEMGLWLAGPATGGILSDWGAEVIKIEPLGGDPMRQLYGHLSGSKESQCPPFHQHNRGKRSVALDINTEAGRDLAERIIGSSDVFLSNMRPAFLKRVGLDHERLLGLHPRLVYAILTGYGLAGPDRDAPGFDVAAFSARSGLVGRSAPEGDPPPTLSGGFGDTVTAISAAAAISAGLLYRERTGQGQLVSTSLLRTGVYCIAMDVATRLGLDRIAPPASRTKPQNPMLNCYPAGDGSWFWLVGAEATRHWPGLVAALGSPEVLSEERFSSPRERRRNSTELVALLDEMFATKSRDEWAKEFAAHDVWWAPVNSIEDLIVDPQLIAAGAFVDMPGENGSGTQAVATPIDFSAAPVGPTGAAPEIGADTVAVLQDLGVAAEEITELKESGVLGVRSGEPANRSS